MAGNYQKNENEILVLGTIKSFKNGFKNIYSLRTFTTISFCSVTVLAVIAIIGGFFLPTLCGLWPLAAWQQETQPFELHASFFQSIAQRTQTPISQFISHRTEFSAEFLIFVSAV